MFLHLLHFTLAYFTAAAITNLALMWHSIHNENKYLIYMETYISIEREQITFEAILS